MRLMALDVGERRVGIATSNSGIFATPHSVLRRKSKKEDYAYIEQLATELNVEKIIVGIPYSLSGDQKIGPQAKRIKRYAQGLAKAVPIPIEYFDESYSTVDAEAYLEAGRGKVPIDAAAAAIILQGYLDTNQDASEPLP